MTRVFALPLVEGHVSHAKIFLLSDGPEGDRCVLTGSANFSTSALLGEQHEVLIRFRDDRAWEHFERQYLGSTKKCGVKRRWQPRPGRDSQAP